MSTTPEITGRAVDALVWWAYREPDETAKEPLEYQVSDLATNLVMALPAHERESALVRIVRDTVAETFEVNGVELSAVIVTE